MLMEHNTIAKELFSGIAPGYDRWAEVFSIFQYRRWHRALLSALDPQPGEHILDVSTGTGAVAFDLAKRGCVVIGLDLSPEMLREASGRALRLKGAAAKGNSVRFVEGRSEDLPFPATSFDVVTFTFLLRYVADPQRSLQEISRVLRTGGRVAMLEFAVPEFTVTRALWSLYVYALLPLLTRPVSPAWAAVGAFLGGSIGEFDERHPLPSLLADWHRAGFCNLRCRQMSVGGAIIVSGEKE